MSFLKIGFTLSVFSIVVSVDTATMAATVAVTGPVGWVALGAVTGVLVVGGIIAAVRA